MIVSLSNVDVSKIDYQVTQIRKYKEANKSKVLIIDEQAYDPIALKELFVVNPKIRLIVISDADEDAADYYEAGVDYVITEENNIAKINGIIHNLDVRHKIISRVQIKEDFNKINVNGVDIRLTPKEMQIYTYLNNNRGNLCKRTTMLTEVLGYHEGADSRVIDVYVKHLRTKLRDEGYKIETIRGKGYIYNF